MTLSKFLNFLCFFIFLHSTTYAQHYQQPEYQQWTETFKAGNLDETIKLVDRNFRNDKPNHHALLTWVVAHSIKGDTDAALKQLTGKLQLQATQLVRLLEYSSENKSLESMKQYSLSQLKQNGGLTSNQLWSELAQSINPIQSYELAVHTLELYDANFRTAWIINNLNNNNIEVYTKLHADLKAGRFEAFPAVKSFLTETTTTPYQNSLEDLLAVEAFLKTHPTDGLAIRYKAHQLKELKRYEEAAGFYKKAWEIDPYYFSGLNLLNASESYALAGTMDVAEKLLRKYTTLYFPKAHDVEFVTRWSGILLDCGRNNEARTVLTSNATAFEASPDFQLAMGKLETASKRPDFAIRHYEKAYQTGSKNFAFSSALINAYIASGKSAEPLSIISGYADKHGMPLDFYYRKAKIFEDAEEFEDAYRIRKESVETYPASSWHWNNFAYICSKTGKKEEAYNAIIQSLSIGNPSAWACARLYDYTKAAFNHEAALEKLAEYATAYPWNKYIWGEYIKHTPDQQHEQHYEEAFKISGAYFHVYELRLNNYIRTGEWAKANAILKRAAEQFSSPEDQRQVAFFESEIIRKKGQKVKLPVAEINQAIAANNRYAKIVGTKDSCWYRDMAAFHIYKHDRETSAVYLDSGLRIDPDSPEILSKIRNDNLREYGVGKLARKFYEHLQRDPYDINRYSDAISFHTKWGGSPLVAIILSQQAKELIPDGYDKVRNLEVMAYGHLGDHVKDFEIRYARENVISSSERYIDWYNSARHAVWKGSSKITVDAKTAIATIQFPDGTIAQRQDDLLSGQVTMLRVGDAFIKAEYNIDGNLTALKASNGKTINLTYDMVTNKISEIDNAENRLKIAYNGDGKIQSISMTGIGRMDISYNEYGETDQITSYDEKGNEGGSQIALRIRTTFSELTTLADILRKAQTLSNARLPDLGIEDKRYTTLNDTWYTLRDQLYMKDDKKKWIAWFKKSVELATYLKDNTHINASYAERCFDVIFDATQEFKQRKNDKIALYGPQLAEIMHELLLKTRRNGVALYWWSTWVDMQEWLQQEKLGETKLTAYRTAIEKAQDKFKNQPVELLATSEWLPKSILQNNGYWKKYPVRELFAKAYQSDLQINTVFKRTNGDYLVGTNKGLLVRHHGYWDHFVYNALRGEMERDLANDQIKASANILSIGETNDNQLLLGTADGLLILSGKEYLGKVSKRVSQLTGLPSNAITAIGTIGNTIYLGTAKGLVTLSGESIALHDAILDPVTFIHQHLVTAQDKEFNLTLGTSKQLWVVDAAGELKKYADYAVDDALISSTGDLYILKDSRVLRYKENSFVELLGNIISTDANQIFALAELPVQASENNMFSEDYYEEDDLLYEPDNDNAIGVLTDMGLSLYHEKHFEHFFLPFKGDKTVQARKHAGHNGSFMLYTGEDFFVFENEQIKNVLDGKVLDIVSANKTGITYIAHQSGVYYVRHDDETMTPVLVDYLNATALAIDKEERLLVNDGLVILRYTFQPEQETFDVEELFYANQFEPKDAAWIKSGDVKKILVAENNIVWVATRLAVFRFEELSAKENKTEEFNYFRAPEKFPSRTHMVYNIVELPDGRIWAVCSNEGHLSYNGIFLSGGLLQWDDASHQFNALNTNGNYSARGFNWFVTSVTKTGSGKAIVGTLGGFGEYNNGEIKDYYTGGGGLKNTTYNSIYEQHPALYLGTQGAALGDLWFFGSASGILAYRNGMWLYPDRLNQMLPKDNEFGNYGGRHVNAVATDKHGRIYAGTDLGLLIYHSQGADPMSFLINNGRTFDAFSAQNEMQLQQEQSTILNSLPITSSSGAIVKELKGIETELRKLKTLKAGDQQHTMIRDSRNTKPVNTDSLTALINDRNKKHYELLLRLEKQDPGVHQLLDVKPVELAALRKNLKAGECLVQYIPTARKLYIQVLAKDKMELREVVVSKDTLMRVSQYVANGLKHSLELTQQLTWLYDQLIRPIKQDLEGYDGIMVIPVQTLCYLPFSALMDKSNGKSGAYALEQFNIAYVSSTYLLGLLMKTEAAVTDTYLLFGDPDGTLPGAGEEVKAIGKITYSNNVFTSKQASLTNLIKNASGARVIHLATHGYLNELAPEESSILLADKKLTMPQIFNLPLDQTEMIVLSACETGKGAGKGIEYATIARAFANAGAPTVLATLWKVDDAATKALMVNFYEGLKRKESKLDALTHAQQKFIADNPDRAHPYYWAGFILMGKSL